MGIVRLVDEEPGQEGSQGHRQPHGLSGGGGAQAHGEGKEQEELRATCLGRPRHERRKHLAREIPEGDQDEGGLAEGGSEAEEALGLERAQLGRHHHENDGGQVLDEADADQHTPVSRMQLASLHEQPGQHHGARHGDHDPDHEPLEGRPAQRGPRARAEPDGEEDGERRAQESHPAHAVEIPQRELDPHREHQENDTDLGEELEAVDVAEGGPRRERTDEEPTHDIAEDEGLARDPGEGATHHGRDEDVREVAEENGVGAHGPERRIPGAGPICFAILCLLPGPALRYFWESALSTCVTREETWPSVPDVAQRRAPRRHASKSSRRAWRSSRTSSRRFARRRRAAWAPPV